MRKQWRYCSVAINYRYHTWPEHDNIIKWKHFPRYWAFVWGIHRSPVNSPHKGQRRGALMSSLICAWIHGWVNNFWWFETPSRPLWHHSNEYQANDMSLTVNDMSLTVTWYNIFLFRTICNDFPNMSLLFMTINTTLLGKNVTHIYQSFHNNIKSCFSSGICILINRIVPNSSSTSVSTVVV